MNEPSRDLPPPVAPLVPWTRKAKHWCYGKALPCLVALVVLAVAGAAYLPGPLSDAKTVIVPHGEGVRDVAALLDSNNAIYSPLLFHVAARVAASGGLKAGEYNIAAGQSMMDVLAMIRDGHSVVRLFTVAEGLTSHDIVHLLAATPALTGDVMPVPAEGSLLPESYRYIYGDSRAGIVARMQKAMQDALTEMWVKRDPNLPITSLDQAVVMASIIEKETGKTAERPRIAGVFYNRLRQHMRLQSDPTVIYGIMNATGAMDHEIAHEDLTFASPYNTYLNDGLPPKPICNPGKAALEAALHPEPNNFLYFVADGSGGHAFAATLAEHNQNVTKWNLLQAKQP